jgi:aryl-phospho-beta-D-glucosidase BglC (GH1 family)
MIQMISRRFYLFFAFFYVLPVFLSAQITPREVVVQMQKGINLGNTLEPPRPGYWGNPFPKEYYFDMYKSAGFNCVRVPVRWDKHTSYSSPYKIQEGWLDSVETVIDWGLARDLFIVINAHHDDWIKQNYTIASYRDRFDSIWSQISVRFKDKSEKLIFEILNEPHGLTKQQNDDMHQRVLSIIRKTNPTRIVIFQGHDWGGSNDLLAAAIPDDDYVIGSFHSYDPYLFGLEAQGTWGTPADVNILRDKFIEVKNWSDANNIPVFMGEFGAGSACDYNSRMKHYKIYVEFAQTYGFAYAAWDNGSMAVSKDGFGILDRAGKKWTEVKDILIYSSALSPAPALSLFQDTIIKLTWTNIVSDHDSIIIQRRTSTGSFVNIAILKGDTTSFYDENRIQNIYYYYRIIAHYNSGEEIYAYPIRIFLPIYVPKVRELFLGVPLQIPGTIEAENFDIGGEGLTYHDADPTNIAGAYRPGEAVDIYDRNGDGYHIGNALPGEWYEYSVNVESDGLYLIDVYLASLQGGGTFQITVGDIQSEIMTAPNTNSALNTQTVSTTMNLTTGEQIMRFTVIDDPLFNIDKIDFGLFIDAVDVTESDNPFVIYQNHVNELIMNYDNSFTIHDICFYNMTGSLVYSKVNPGNILKIPLSGISSGIYIVKVSTDKQLFSSKIFIK